MADMKKLISDGGFVIYFRINLSMYFSSLNETISSLSFLMNKDSFPVL